MSLIQRYRARRPRRFRLSANQKYSMAKSAIGYAGKLYKTFRKGKPPSRLRVSQSRTLQTKRMTNLMKNVSGSKYQGHSSDCLPLIPKPAGTQPINYIFMNTGKTLTASGGSLVNYVPMNLFKFPQGTGNDERLGDYMYLRNTHIKFEIQALPTTASVTQPVIQFRFLVVKANRKYNEYGVLQDPGNTLFLDTQNDAFGYGIPGGTSTSSNFLNFSAPINKRDWLVYCDKRFKLSAPSAVGTTLPTTQNAFEKYNTKKYVSINLASNKKTHFINSATANNNVPDNFDSQWFVIVQAIHGSYCADNTTSPRNWTMNVVGTTSAFDN